MHWNVLKCTTIYSNACPFVCELQLVYYVFILQKALFQQFSALHNLRLRATSQSCVLGFGMACSGCSRSIYKFFLMYYSSCFISFMYIGWPDFSWEEGYILILAETKDQTHSKHHSNGHQCSDITMMTINTFVTITPPWKYWPQQQ